MVKNPPAVKQTWVQSMGPEDPQEEGMTTHSRILAWSIPWTEEPGGATVHGVAKSQTRLSASHSLGTHGGWCVGVWFGVFACVCPYRYVCLLCVCSVDAWICGVSTDGDSYADVCSLGVCPCISGEFGAACLCV